MHRLLRITLIRFIHCYHRLTKVPVYLRAILYMLSKNTEANKERKKTKNESCI